VRSQARAWAAHWCFDRGFIDVARIVRQHALADFWAEGNPTGECATVAAVEDDGQLHSFIESGVEDARHLSIAHVVAAGPRVRGNECAIRMHLPAVDHETELVALAVEAQRSVAGVVENDRVAPGGAGRRDISALRQECRPA